MNYIQTAFEPYYEGAQIFIKSPMGTGKTHLIGDWIKERFANKRVLFVSFRKSLTGNVAQRLEFESYLDAKRGELYEIKPGKGLVCQIESTAKISNLSQVDLVIVDEFDSVLQHLLQASKSDPNKMDPLLAIIQDLNCTKIFMDAFITTGHVKLVQELNNFQPAHVIVNRFNLRNGHKMIVNDFIKVNNETTKRMAEQILGFVQNGEKIVVPVTSKKAGQFIYEELKKANVQNVRFYHGENDIIEEVKTVDGKVVEHVTHGKNKKIEFSDVSKHWGNVDVLIFTSTIVAGVDYSGERFDRLVGALCPRTSSPNYFVQQLMRVRRFSKKEHFIYITNDAGKLSQKTPLQAFTAATAPGSRIVEMFNQKLQMRHFLNSKNSVISTFQQNYTIDAIKHIGFVVEFEGVAAPKKVKTEDLESTINALSVQHHIEEFKYDFEFLESLAKRQTDEVDQKFIPEKMEGGDLYVKGQIHFRLLAIGIKTPEQLGLFANLGIERQVHHIMHYEDAKLVRQMFKGYPTLANLLENGFVTTYEHALSRADSELEKAKETG